MAIAPGDARAWDALGNAHVYRGIYEAIQGGSGAQWLQRALADSARAWALAAGVPDVSGLTWGSFLSDNLLPVTIGNVIGGAVMVGIVYWFVYLRGRPSA